MRLLLVCNRPAVSTTSTSARLASAAFTASNTAAAGSNPAAWRPGLVGARDGAEHDLLACAVREVGGDRGAEVGRDQELLELLVERVVDRAVGLEHGGETGGEVFLGALQPVTQALLQTRKQG